MHSEKANKLNIHLGELEVEIFRDDLKKKTKQQKNQLIHNYIVTTLKMPIIISAHMCPMLR